MTAESCTKANYNILKAARALSHFKTNVQEGLNKMETAIHIYESAL